jgi:metallopeptidase MepB
MHDLLARTKYARFHGYNVPREFGEGIGTMLENFCWIKDGLKAMSCHYTEINPKYREAWQEANPGCPLPPKTIPDELVENLIQSRPVSRLLHYLDLL